MMLLKDITLATKAQRGQERVVRRRDISGGTSLKGLGLNHVSGGTLLEGFGSKEVAASPVLQRVR